MKTPPVHSFASSLRAKVRSAGAWPQAGMEGQVLPAHLHSQEDVAALLEYVST